MKEIKDATGWIKKDSLHDVTVRLLAIAKNDKKLLTGELLAIFANRLLELEVKPGGPYKEDPKLPPKLETNIAIAQLFRLLGAPLISLESYIYGNSAGPEKINPPNKQNNRKPTPAALAVQKIIDSQAEPIKSNSQKVWQSIVKADKNHEISSISKFFVESLQQPLNLSPKIIHRLNTANFFLWMAYTLYDDFIDEEGSPGMLPVANMSHRESLLRFMETAKLLNQPSEIVLEFFKSLDQANAWEVHNCRFDVKDSQILIGELPRYDNDEILANRAIAHLLGPWLITQTTKASPQQKAKVLTGLKHYLIARQLNDDLHDWVDDLSTGQITYVVAHLLKQANTPGDKHQLNLLIPSLKETFWKSELESLLSIITNHTKLARRSLKSSGLILPNSILEKHTIEPIESSTKEALCLHLNEKSFLHHFQKN